MKLATKGSTGEATSSPGVPTCRSRPSTITPTRSASAAASSKSCVTRIAGSPSSHEELVELPRTAAFVCASSADKRLVEQQHARARARAPARARRADARRRRCSPARLGEVADPEPLQQLRDRRAARRAEARRSADSQVREQRVLLEDEPDPTAAPAAGRRRARCRATSRRRARPPRSGRSRPAIAAARSTCRHPRARPARASPAALERQLEGVNERRGWEKSMLERAIGDELDGRSRSHADDDQRGADRERRVEIDVELLVDRERERLGDALQRAGEHDRRAELAEPAREDRAAPAPSPPAASGSAMRANVRAGPGAEGPRGGGSVGSTASNAAIAVRR